MKTENFKLLGTDLPVGPLLEALAEQEHLYEDIPSNLRNTYPGSAHFDTQSILLRWCFPFNERTAFNDLVAVDYPAVWFLCKQVAPVLNALVALTDSQHVGRVMVNRLRAHGEIAPHIDEGAYSDFYQRFHVCLDSDDGNTFFCGGESVQMKPGEAWWFNHKREHFVLNQSARARTHLLIDAIAPSFETAHA